MPTNWCTWHQSLSSMHMPAFAFCCTSYLSLLQGVALFHVLPYPPVPSICSLTLAGQTKPGYICGSVDAEQCKVWKVCACPWTTTFFLFLVDFCWKLEWQKRLHGDALTETWFLGMLWSLHYSSAIIFLVNSRVTTDDWWQAYTSSNCSITHRVWPLRTRLPTQIYKRSCDRPPQILELGFSRPPNQRHFPSSYF